MLGQGSWEGSVDQANGNDHRVFIVRVWHDPDAEGPAALRGSVRDVSGGPDVFFTSARDLADFIALRSRDSIDDQDGG